MQEPASQPVGSARYVGRGGQKLRHALDAFAIDPAGLVCADLGCNVGGFTDCLLQAGASRVYAVDTGYGALAYTLRVNPRVVVMERTNALHAQPAERVALVVLDMGWTPQRLCVPAALRWTASGGRVITLIKPHYEASDAGEQHRLVKGVLPAEDAEIVSQRVASRMESLGARVEAMVRSPLVGGAGKKNASGNIEYLALLRPLS